MKREQGRIFLVNIAAALLIGILVGAIDALFGRVLFFVSDIRDAHLLWFIPFLGIAGVIILYAYKKLNEHSLKGMTLVFQTGHGQQEKIPLMLIPLVMFGTWLTHLCGGSAGREGVAVQLGATVAHSIGRILKMPDNAKVLLIAGMAAGFAGLFQTPITATLFAMEVLIAGVIQYDALLPALTAAFVASETSHRLGLERFSKPIEDSIIWSFDTIWKIIMVAVIFGLAGGAFAFLLKHLKKQLVRWIANPWIRILSMGIVLSVLLLLFQYGRYCGMGTNLIELSFTGGTVYWYDWILKLGFTVLTLSAGYQGGEVTPLFAIGASLGAVLATLFGLPVALVAALGYAAVFGSATNTILAPILIGAEVFGSQHLVFFVVVCSIAYVFNGNQTIYSAQKKVDLSKDFFERNVRM